jgi:hypothetical protein
MAVGLFFGSGLAGLCSTSFSKLNRVFSAGLSKRMGILGYYPARVHLLNAEKKSPGFDWYTHFTRSQRNKT